MKSKDLKEQAAILTRLRKQRETKPLDEKDSQREEIANHTKEFLKNGGEIKKLEIFKRDKHFNVVPLNKKTRDAKQEKK